MIEATTQRSGNECPQARSEGLLTEHVGDELVIFDAETNEAHALKPLAAAVFAGADGHAPIAELATSTSVSLGRNVQISEVEAALSELSRVGLLRDSDLAGGVSRRRLLQIGGATAAGVLVSSAVVPALAAASTTGCNVNQASQVGLLVEDTSNNTYSFLTFAVAGTTPGKTLTTFTCNVGLNGSKCTINPPSTGTWYLDGHAITGACPSSASLQVYASSVTYTVPTGYQVIALYGHALGTTGQYCSGPFTSGVTTGTTGSVSLCP